MTDMVQFSEEQTRADLARLLTGAVEASGRTRCDIARDAQIHKDALRRVLTGKRSATLGGSIADPSGQRCAPAAGPDDVYAHQCRPIS